MVSEGIGSGWKWMYVQRLKYEVQLKDSFPVHLLSYLAAKVSVIGYFPP